MKTNKKRIELEYLLNCTVASLYAKLSTEEGLESWFADRVVKDNDGMFTFYWHKIPQQAELISFKENKFVRFHWAEDDSGDFFELAIDPHELTGDIGLMITDFCDEEECEDEVQMWENCVKNLKRTLGCS